MGRITKFEDGDKIQQNTGKAQSSLPNFTKGRGADYLGKGGGKTFEDGYLLKIVQNGHTNMT